MKTAPADAYAYLADMLEASIDIKHREAYLDFHARHMTLFLDMPASVNGHHSWPGGYAVHIAEVVRNIVYDLADPMVPVASRPTLSDAVVAAYVHDKDKLLTRYERDPDKPTDAQLGHHFVRKGVIKIDANETKASLSKKIDAAVKGAPQPLPEDLPRHRYRDGARDMDDSAAVLLLCHQHGLIGAITDDIAHAVSLHHGGWAPLAQAKNRLRLRPLAEMLHAADQKSAVRQCGEVVA